MQACSHCQYQNTDVALFCRGCGQPLGARAHLTGALSSGALLQGRYQIVACVGTGGMGAVYRAEDLRLPGARWAVKEMSDAQLSPIERQEAIKNFQQEAHFLSMLDHPHLPRVADYFPQAGKWYLVMEFVDGQTLEEIMAAAGSRFLDERRVVGWIGQVCDVLGYLHGRRPPIIFRDLKPANIMLDRQGQVNLIDFGIARHFKPGQTADTMPMGTPGYAAPEAFGTNQTDARSDVYSLGVTLHRLLTHHDPGIVLFALPPARSLNPAVSLRVEVVIGRATQRDPAHRYQSAAEMKQALLQAAARPPVTPARPPAPAPGALPVAPTGATRQVPIPGRAPQSPLSPPTGRTGQGPSPGRPGAGGSPAALIPGPKPRQRTGLGSFAAVGGGLLLLLALVAGGVLLTAGDRGRTSYIPSRTPTRSTLSTPGGGVDPSPIWLPTSTPGRATATRLPDSPDPTATPRSAATKTSRPTATPVPDCGFAAQGQFAALWQAHHTELGCPLQQRPQAIQDAEQLFQNGRMLWRMDTRRIYVIYEKGGRAGTFQEVADRWQEGQAEYPCTASPPAGLLQPRRGFGLVWCEQGAANAPIGWGLSEELGFGGSYPGEPLVQDFERGTIFGDNDSATRGLAYIFLDDGTFSRERR